MSNGIIHDAVTVVTTETVVELCEAGRYREAAAALEGLDPDLHPLAFGMVETARGNQELAKDYLSRAVRQGAGDKAIVQLACAYWRSGESKEADALLIALPDSFESLILKAIVVGEMDPREALDYLARATKYNVSEGLQARLHNQRALMLRKLGETDRAIQEYDAAIHYFRLAKSDCVPIVIKNLAGVYLDCGEYEQAHQQIDTAISLLENDLDHLAKAWDQKARIYLAQNCLAESEQAARVAVRTVEQTDKKAWIAECLLTLSVVLIQVGRLTEGLTLVDRIEDIGHYVSNDQILFEAATIRKQIADRLAAIAEMQRIKTALRTSQSIRCAAKKLGMSHVALLNAMDRAGIKRKPRPKSIVKR